MQQQCIIPPLFGSGGDDDPPRCSDPGRALACPGGCCVTGGSCNWVNANLCCLPGYPVSCTRTCCAESDTCRSDDRCCPAGYPVDCANVCCPPDTVCGSDDTCLPGGGTDCSCRCDDGSVCTSHADCGLDAYGIPNVCGCPVGPPCY